MNLHSDDALGDEALFADFDPDEFVLQHRKRNKTTSPASDRTNNTNPNPIVPLDIGSHVQTDVVNVNQELHKTLFNYFGYSSFREGQLDIISSIVVEKKDAAFFSPTGKGKSMCYLIPPLYLKQIAVVVSPLISLMQDQVTKLNSIQGIALHRNIATFLGSGQADLHAEQQALQGHYSIIYCTPEKLNGSPYFLQALADLHLRDTHSRICLFAVDESHCVSEWGHDFRPHYRTIGKTLRTHPILQHIPILALTATAVPRVKQDIISSLHFRPGQSHVVTQSVDRPNLILNIRRKRQGGFKEALAPFLMELTSVNDKRAELDLASTIIYAPTQHLVDEISSWIQSQLLHKEWVLPYHAGLSMQDRTTAHLNFLIGKTKIVVATVAFGMGIDKPDIRRIIHYGAPPTVEDYYQQIGRCGRDGMESYCTLFCDEADFATYKSSFYMGNLPMHVKSAREQSIDSFRNFCMNDELCRRAQLLQYFGQQVTFEGKRCGTCDTCMARIQHASDLERDFSDQGARLILYAISVLKENSAASSIESVLNGKILESHRYRDISPQTIQTTVQSMKNAMNTGKRWSVSKYTKGLLPALVNAGYIERKDMSAQIRTFTNTWVGYNLSVKGKEALISGPIILPVPTFIRELETNELTKSAARRSELENLGVDVSKIPDHELECGDGEVTRSLETWHRYLSNLEKRNKVELVNALDDLRLRLDSWRSDMAVLFHISPSSVLPEHLLLKIAYMSATLPPKAKVDTQALVASGLRIGNMEMLIRVLDEWRNETFKRDENSDEIEDTTPITLPEDPYQPAHPWPFMEYKPKKSGLPNWEISYNRFIAGEHPQTIAITQVGRPIQVATVVSHILTALTAGKCVPLRRLAETHKPPTITEWKMLSMCEEETKMNVCNDPKTGGCCGEPFSMKDFLVPILGNNFTSKDYSDRTEEEQEQFSRWCNLLNWYMALRRANVLKAFI